MAYRICAMCGKFFDNDGDSRCPKCRVKYEQEYQMVKECIRTHAGTTPIEVNAITGVSISTILKFLDDGLISCSNG